MTTDPGQLQLAADAATRLAESLDAPSEHTQRLATLGTIAGLIAHEFNNLLTPVLSYAQMALADPDNRELGVKALQRAVSGAERASQIATAILGFVRDDSSPGQSAPVGGTCSTWNSAGAAPAIPPPPIANVRSCCEDALACLGRNLASDGIHLELAIDPEAHAAIKPVALQHVVLNIVLNARKAMSGGGRLALGTPALGASTSGDWCNVSATSPGAAHRAPLSPPPNVTVLEISDSGCGMSATQLRSVCTPFFTQSNGEHVEYQTLSDHHAPGRERRRGTGLGMTICKRLVEDAGGQIWMRSAVGRGTTVRIILPTAVADADTDQRPERRDRRKPARHDAA